MIESYYIASETRVANPAVQNSIERVLEGLPYHEVSHEELKRISNDSQVFVRTGECTSFANVVLVCGVTF